MTDTTFGTAEDVASRERESPVRPDAPGVGRRGSLGPSPVVSIRAGGGGISVGIRDLIFYHELLYFLIWRDVKVRYKQTLFGIAWAVLQPLFTMLIFSLFFGRLAHMPSDGVPYPLFAFAGLVPWTFFSNAVTNSGNSLVGSANLITKVYFPRVLVPAAAVGAGLVDLALGLVVLAGLIAASPVPMTANILMLPVLVVLTALFALGVGMWMSALNVRYRDVRYALPFLVQLWMFATPVIYPTSIVPSKWRWLMSLNPLSGLIEGYRSSVLGLEFDWASLGTSGVLVVLVLVGSAFSFRRMERSFADVI